MQDAKEYRKKLKLIQHKNMIEAEEYYNNNNNNQRKDISDILTAGKSAGLGAGNAYVIDMLTLALKREMEVELIQEAVRIAAFAPRPSWAYVQGILRNWTRAGYTTLDEYEAKSWMN